MELSLAVVTNDEKESLVLAPKGKQEQLVFPATDGVVPVKTTTVKVFRFERLGTLGCAHRLLPGT